MTVLDTAGLRDTDDIVEGMGVARAKERAERADFRIHLVMDPSEMDADLGSDDLVVQARLILSGRWAGCFGQDG